MLSDSTQRLSSPGPAGDDSDLPSRTTILKNGSFSFDQVVLSGLVERVRPNRLYHRVRRQPHTFHAVLRPAHFALYKDPEHTKLRYIIQLDEIKGVFLQKTSNRRTRPSDADVQLARTTGAKDGFTIFGPPNVTIGAAGPIRPAEWVSAILRQMELGQVRVHTYFCPELVAEFSRHEDHPGAPTIPPVARLPPMFPFSAPTPSSVSVDQSDRRPGRPTQFENGHRSRSDQSPESKPVAENWVWVRRDRCGVPRWDRHWAVLRHSTFILYPNEKEHMPTDVIYVGADIQGVVPMADKYRNRPYCFFLITSHSQLNYRISVKTDDQFTSWIAAFDSVLGQSTNVSAGHSSIRPAE